MVIFSCALLLLGCAGCKSRLDRRSAGILSNATKVEVFRIDGGSFSSEPAPIKLGDPTVGGYAILARGADQGAEFAAKLAAILTENKTYANHSAKCFWPGVAFRVWKGEESVDVIICFFCHNFYIGPPTDTRVMENASFADSPNTNRLIQLAKEAFPNDKEVQALEEK